MIKVEDLSYTNTEENMCLCLASKYNLHHSSRIGEVAMEKLQYGKKKLCFVFVVLKRGINKQHKD